MRAGYVVKVNTHNEITQHYLSDKEFDYENQKLQRLIGCQWIERVALAGVIMVVNEEGLLDGSEYNTIASNMYGGDIMGNALFMTEMMTDEGMDFAGLTEEEADALIEKLRKKL